MVGAERRPRIGLTHLDSLGPAFAGLRRGWLVGGGRLAVGAWDFFPEFCLKELKIT